MNEYKIYSDGEVKTVSLGDYRNWLLKNGAFYYIGPNITEDNREIYTAFTANSFESSCFSTFEISLDEDGASKEENIYASGSWAEAKAIHKKLLKVKSKGKQTAIH